jgi:hypothetical protein
MCACQPLSHCRILVRVASMWLSIPCPNRVPHLQAEKVALELADKRAERAVLRLLARAHREVRMGMRPPADRPCGAARV